VSSLATAVQAEEFHAPGPGNFNLPSLFDLGETAITKPMVQLLLSAVLVFGFFYLAIRRGSLVPGKLQYAGESAYGMVRNSVARDVIGGHDFRPFVPYLVTIFFFVLVNNLFAAIPLIQFPTFSRASMAYALAALSWVTYNAVGIRRHGLLGYLRRQCVPHGVTPVMYPLLVPLEFFSNIVVRPITLALRLFANMFAGHLLLVMFTVASWYLLNGWLAPAGAVSFIMAMVMILFELFVQAVQAYVFVLLACSYVQGALAEHH
jgi:F-type H+-transporting ATPase subunit a